MVTGVGRGIICAGLSASILLAAGCGSSGDGGTITGKPFVMLTPAKEIVAAEESANFGLIAESFDVTITESRVDFDGDGTWDSSILHNTSTLVVPYEWAYSATGTFAPVAEILSGGEVLGRATAKIQVVDPEPMLVLDSLLSPAVSNSTGCVNVTINAWNATLRNVDVIPDSPNNVMNITTVEISYQWQTAGISTSPVMRAISSTIGVGSTAAIPFSPIDSVTPAMYGQAADVTLVFKGQTVGGQPVEVTETAELEVQDCTALSAPTNLTASSSTPSTMNLTWTNTSGAVDGFKVYRGVPGQPVASFAEIGSPTSPAFTDSQLQSDTAYDYRVRAFVGTSLSPASSREGGVTTVSWSGDVYPMFSQSNCVACHRGAPVCGNNGEMDLTGSASTTYGEVHDEVSACRLERRVNTTTPVDSLILRLPSDTWGGGSHPGGPKWPMTSDQYRRMKRWIEQGAEQN